jgi:hypothetical protein
MIKKSERLTKAICNKGFSWYSSILPRIKFRVGGQDSSPQSLTAYSLNRYKQALKMNAISKFQLI